VKRREFLRGAVAISAGLVAGRAGSFGQSSRAADSRVEILIGEEIGTINRDIYGHFAEHLGGVVYDGIWVGENSKVPNTGGIRRALVDAMKRIKAPVIRWPGGCFADSYDWRDAQDPVADARAAQISGQMRPNGRRMLPMVRGSSKPITLGQMNFFASVSCAASVTRLQIALV
jgi:hypothetical protein